MPYLIDGYNVYHAALKVEGEWARLVPAALCRFLAVDMGLMREKGTVVFDGARRRGETLNLEPPETLAVVYCGRGKDADTLIKMMIADNSAPKRLVVVSSDREILRAARRRKAKCLTSLEYLEAMIRRTLQRPHRRREPIEKWVGLSDGDLYGWLRFLEITPKPPSGDDEMLDWIRF